MFAESEILLAVYNDTWFVLGVTATGLLSLPGLYWLPIARVKHWFNMASAWSVPEQTFLFSRLLVCFVGTAAIGNAMAYLALTALGLLPVALAAVTSLQAVVFNASAARRFRKPAGTEFSMGLFRMRGLLRPGRPPWIH